MGLEVQFHAGRESREVKRLFCLFRGHRVFLYVRPGVSALSRDGEGVSACCVDCGKKLRAPYGLALPGFRLGTFV